MVPRGVSKHANDCNSHKRAKRKTSHGFASLKYIVMGEFALYLICIKIKYILLFKYSFVNIRYLEK